MNSTVNTAVVLNTYNPRSPSGYSTYQQAEPLEMSCSVHRVHFMRLVVLTKIQRLVARN
jgi:hypothetical protein